MPPARGRSIASIELLHFVSFWTAVLRRQRRWHIEQIRNANPAKESSPESHRMSTTCLILAAKLGKTPALVLYTTPVSCGFPSPAAEFEELPLDLADHLIQRPAATFFVRFKGQSLTGLGIYDGDIGVVDRSLTPKAGDVVVAVVDGSLVAKQLARRQGRLVLASAHPTEPAIEVSEESDCQIWGVVTSSIRAHRP